MAFSPEMLSELFRFLLKRSNDAHARAETMRLLLMKHGVVSEKEFAELHAQVLRETTKRAEQLIDRAESAEHAAAIRQLLQDFDGPIQ